MKNRFATICLAFLLPLVAFSQGNRITTAEFIATYRDLAIEEMNIHKIPASIKLAQAILESGAGNSELAQNANNLFGIKCSGWQGRTYFKDDDKPNECFRAYNSTEESFRDHSQFLRTRAWYAPLFDLPITDYKGWAQGLQRAGYATNPNYSMLLISIIENNNLFELDALYGLAEEPTRYIQTPIEPEPVQKAEEPTQKEIVRPVDFQIVGRQVEVNNRIKYIIAREGDTPESIGREFNKQPRHIIEYNELGESGRISVGQIIYLQPKRNRGERAFHIVQPGETMYDIAQQYGIRLEALLNRNNITSDGQLLVGQRIRLR